VNANRDVEDVEAPLSPAGARTFKEGGHWDYRK
jgi:hypothetical protein